MMSAVRCIYYDTHQNVLFLVVSQYDTYVVPLSASMYS